MFRWLTRTKVSLPPLAPGNPGEGATLRAAFSNAGRTRSEEADVVALLRAELGKRSIPCDHSASWVRLANGLLLRPLVVSFEAREDGSVRTTTSIDINHPTLCVGGTFEYQHSLGDNLSAAFQDGLSSWCDTDLPVFMDALNPQQTSCMSMRLTFPAKEPNSQRRRQVILGPPLHYAQRDPVAQESVGVADHDFCPCCLLTNSLDAFRVQLQSDAFVSVRLFASRSAAGMPQADCRVNGIDWQPGEEALCDYAAGWPARGLEYRKQFVAIRTLQSAQ